MDNELSNLVSLIDQWESFFVVFKSPELCVSVCVCVHGASD